MNSLFIEGKLGKDAALKVVPSGKSVLEFSVAVTESYKKDNAWHKHTEWFDCALWGKQAESRLPEYLLKGQQVAVSGELGSREHEGKTYLTCRVNSVDLVGGKSETPVKPSTPEPQTSKAPVDDFDEDLPF